MAVVMFRDISAKISSLIPRLSPGLRCCAFFMLCLRSVQGRQKGAIASLHQEPICAILLAACSVPGFRRVFQQESIKDFVTFPTLLSNDVFNAEKDTSYYFRRNLLRPFPLTLRIVLFSVGPPGKTWFDSASVSWPLIVMDSTRADPVREPP